MKTSNVVDRVVVSSAVHEIENVRSRAQAITDGVLVDVTDVAKMLALRNPVAVTDAVWRQCIDWTEADSDRQVSQSTRDRLWDVVFALSVYIRSNKITTTTFLYELPIVPRDGITKTPQVTVLRVVGGRGDHGEAVITIQLARED